jgi:glycosyltransferase involved in cell wall biosynthesis
MRVLHLLSSTGFHGAENMAAQLIRDLSSQGVENYLGVFWNNEGSNTDIVGLVRDVAQDSVIFNCRGKLDWRVMRELRGYIRRHQIDAIHSHKYKTNLYAIIARLGLRCALISTCHNWLLTDARMRFYAAFDKRVLMAFDKIVGVSQEVTEELRRYISAEKIAKIDNGVDLQRFSGLIEKRRAKEELGIRGGTIIGYVGRITPEKGISCLLRAARLLRDHGTQADILIVGDGDSRREFEKEAAHLEIGDRVHFLGQRNDTPQIYAAMDIFVLPSLKEAFPMVVLEAMASGVPVIATRVGDIPYIFGNGECGVLVEPNADSELSEAMNKLLADRGAAQRMALAGQRRVRTRFSSLEMARSYRKLYQETLADRRVIH